MGELQHVAARYMDDRQTNKPEYFELLSPIRLQARYSISSISGFDIFKVTRVSCSPGSFSSRINSHDDMASVPQLLTISLLGSF